MWIVIEGIHGDPNDMDTIDIKTKITHGPFEVDEANSVCKTLMQKNIDDYYHKAWVIKL